MPVKSLSFKNFLILAFLALLFSTISFFTQDRLQWRDLFLKPVQTQKPPSLPIAFLSLTETIVAFYQKDVLFLDVREEKQYQYGHIQNAINLPVTHLEQLDLKLIEKLKNFSTVVIYCNGIGCGASYHCATKLRELGVENAQVYSEGWPEWRLCRLPISASPELQKELQKEWGQK